MNVSYNHLIEDKIPSKGVDVDLERWTGEIDTMAKLQMFKISVVTNFIFNITNYGINLHLNSSRCLQDNKKFQYLISYKFKHFCYKGIYSTSSDVFQRLLVTKVLHKTDNLRTFRGWKQFQPICSSSYSVSPLKLW